MNRPAGRQDLRARSWEVIRDDRFDPDVRDLALRMLALIERADLSVLEAEAELRTVLDRYVVSDDGRLTYVDLHPGTVAALSEAGIEPARPSPPAAGSEVDG